MFKKMTLEDIDLAGKKVLVRVDFNVPLKGKEITDDTRIVTAIPTIRYILDEGAAIILISHLGRPGGKRDEQYSLEPVAAYLDTLLDEPVYFVNDCVGMVAEKAVNELKAGEILLLENTRFHPGETENDPEFGKELASLADVFINDAFGTSHRSHASNVGIANHLPSVAGFLLEKEIKYLGEAISNPERPFTAILGGAKVSGKINVIKNLVVKVDHILVGGGMANTFFAAQGFQMGESLVENEVISLAKDLFKEAKTKMLLPVDVIIADDFNDNANMKTIAVGDVPAGWRILDIGPETVKAFSKVIDTSKTVVWNGPMGVFELKSFATGTFEIARSVAKSKAISIIGGGDSVAAVRQAGLAEDITHISTGGGASLKMLEGAELPGLKTLDDK